MPKKRRLWLVGIVLLGVGALLLPISNLVVGLPGEATLGPTDPPRDVHRDAIVALATKCGNCHSAQGAIPFYAGLPGAKSIVAQDIARGTRYLDMAEAFSQWPVGEVALAKIEHSVVHRTMPPMRYMVLHWNGGLTKAQQQSILDLVTSLRVAHYANDAFPDEIRRLVVRPVPPAEQVHATKAALGRKLYHDPRLSKDDSISCASCHDLARGGTDRQQVSTGVGGQKGGINAPTVFNAVFNMAQFWDGRAADLQAQADGPPNNPIEMASSWPEIIGKLSSDAALQEDFLQSYPEGFTAETITHAIAEFEKTLVTPGCALDRYLVGEEGALGDDAKAGYELFLAMGCATCHVGHAMGGQSYEEMGRARDYFAARGGAMTDADLGRYNVTKKQEDRHRFKVPLLRNIAVTAPYFHDGSVSDLGEAAQKMAVHMLDESLSVTQRGRMVTFLESLTGTYQGAPLR